MDEAARRQAAIMEFKDISNRMAENMQRVSIQAIEFLTLTNGGAAVACLAYMGSDGRWHNGQTLRLLLVLFLVGLLLVGAIVSRGYSFAHRQTATLLRDGLEIGTTDMTPEKVVVNFRHRVIVDKPLQFVDSQRRIGILSFVCFVLGVLVAAVWLSQVTLNGPVLATKPPGH